MDVVLEMLHVVDSNVIDLAPRIGTTHSVVDIELIDMIQDVPPKSVQLAELSCAIFKAKSFVSDTEETLERVALHGNELVNLRRSGCRQQTPRHLRMRGLAPLQLQSKTQVRQGLKSSCSAGLHRSGTRIFGPNQIAKAALSRMDTVYTFWVVRAGRDVPLPSSCASISAASLRAKYSFRG